MGYTLKKDYPFEVKSWTDKDDVEYCYTTIYTDGILTGYGEETIVDTGNGYKKSRDAYISGASYVVVIWGNHFAKCKPYRSFYMKEPFGYFDEYKLRKTYMNGNKIEPVFSSMKDKQGLVLERRG